MFIKIVELLIKLFENYIEIVKLFCFQFRRSSIYYQKVSYNLFCPLESYHVWRLINFKIHFVDQNFL